VNLSQFKSVARIFILVSVVTLLVCNALTLSTWRQQINANENGQLGAEFAPGIVDKRLRIVRLQEDGALARAGAKAGDLIDFAHKGTPLRETFSLTEVVKLNLYRGNVTRQLEVRPLASPKDGNRSVFSALVLILNTLIALGLVVAIVVRKGHEGAMLAFSIAMLLMSPTSFHAYLPAGGLQDAAAAILRPLDYVGGYLFFLLFSLMYPSDNVLLKRRFVLPALLCFSVIFLVSTILWRSAKIGVMYVPPDMFTVSFTISRFCAAGTSILSLCVLAHSWSKPKPGTRSRIAWILLCIGTTYILWIAFELLELLGYAVRDTQAVFVINVVSFFAYIGFGYALLRHKIFDFGFAVNRTVVFTITSLLLFLAFWLIEQLVHKVVHFEAAEKNAMLGGAIAFGLFFAFNRLHHRVEHWIEHLFFKTWRIKESELRRFVVKAAHYAEIDALIAAFCAALERFTGMAGTAIYLASADGGYSLAHCSLPALPPWLPVDHDIAVTLRSTRKYRQLDEADTGWQNGRAFPIFHGNELNGLVLLRVPAGSPEYRPDQYAMLEFAISRISSEISSLQGKQLAKKLNQTERECERWRRELECLKHQHKNLQEMLCTSSLLIEKDAPG